VVVVSSEIRIEHDDDMETVIESINEALAEHDLTLVYDEDQSADGVVILTLEELEEDQ